MSTAPEKFLPSLPGYKVKEHKDHYKHKTLLKYVDGGMFLVKPESKEFPNIDANASFDGSMSLHDSLLVSPQSKNKTMTFYATYGEWNHLTQELDPKSCMIQYFIDDKTIKITETAQLNNGISKEVTLKRTLLLKDDGTPYEIEDFSMSNYNYINNVNYNIIDADDGTRKFLAKWYKSRFGESTPTSSPDKHSDEWSKHRVQKNADNIFNEAILGNTVNNSKRDGFVNYGDRTLKFICLCENTSVVGEKSPAASIAPEPFKLFTLVYHLCDDSIEIFAVPDPKISDPFTRLLKRSYLPKKPITTSSIVGVKDEDYFLWTDLSIGIEMVVFSRHLKLIDCDSSTRSFYASKGYRLADSIAPPNIPKIEFIREIPPPTAFGSEEDSLRSCVGSLRPSAPRAKIFDEDIVLGYKASLLSGGPDDIDRRFIIKYFVTDKTLQILEPPVKNSGFVGGVFLSRREIKSFSGEKLTPKDFIIGNPIQILKHTFKIEKADNKTVAWMEHKKFIQSNIDVILKKIAPFFEISINNDELKDDFEQLSKNTNYITKDDLDNILKKYIPTSYWKPYDSIDAIPTVLNEHEIITIQRAFSPEYLQGAFDYQEFMLRLREVLK